jgi:hypothetical protein
MILILILTRRDSNANTPQLLMPRCCRTALQSGPDYLE